MERRKKEKTTTLALVFLIILITIVATVDWHTVGIYAGCHWWQRLTYPFFHANILHVLLNGWCLLAIVFIYDITLPRLFLAYIVAVSFPIDTLYNIIPTLANPTVGISAMVFFLFASISFEVKRRLYYQAWMVAYLVLGFFFPNTSAWIHLYCYIIGFIYALLNKPILLCKTRY